MDHIIEGVIVNPEIHESKQIQGDYVDGKFIDTETYNRIFNESVELGAKVAETVYHLRVEIKTKK